MTYPEALDEVARKHGHERWFDISILKVNNNGEVVSNRDRETYHQEAAELYAKSKWEEACELQIESCLYSAKVKYLSCGDPMTCGCQGHCDHPTGIINRKSIKEAPKPEFKP